MALFDNIQGAAPLAYGYPDDAQVFIRPITILGSTGEMKTIYDVEAVATAPPAQQRKAAKVDYTNIILVGVVIGLISVFTYRKLKK